MGPPAKDTLSMQNVKLMLLIDKKEEDIAASDFKDQE